MPINRFFETMERQAGEIETGSSEEVAVYSFANNSLAAAYKSISVSTKTFVDTKFYDLFGVNYIKG